MKQELFRIILIWENEEVQTEYEMSDSLLRLVHETRRQAGFHPAIKETMIYRHSTTDPDSPARLEAHYKRDGF